MAIRVRRQDPLPVLKRKPDFKSLLGDMYQMESESDAEEEIRIDLPLAQLEGD